MVKQDNFKLTREHVKEALLAYLQKNPRSGYDALEWVFDEVGFSWRGELVICSADNPNIVFWEGWNEAAITLINELTKAELIVKEPAIWVERLTFGRVPALPIVKRYYQYRTEHWLPVVFSLAEDCTKAEE